MKPLLFSLLLFIFLLYCPLVAAAMFWFLERPAWEETTGRVFLEEWETRQWRAILDILIWEGRTVAFLAGAFASGLAGVLGMRVATRAAVRTAEAARTSLGGALRLAFGSGTVMGLMVVGLGSLFLLGLFVWKGSQPGCLDRLNDAG